LPLDIIPRRVVSDKSFFNPCCREQISKYETDRLAVGNFRHLTEPPQGDIVQDTQVLMGELRTSQASIRAMAESLADFKVVSKGGTAGDLGGELEEWREGGIRVKMGDWQSVWEREGGEQMTMRGKVWKDTEVVLEEGKGEGPEDRAGVQGLG
jgi:hypothetical protein